MWHINHMKTLFHEFYSKFYDNYYVVYNTCFNKYNVIIHLKTLILSHPKFYTKFFKYHSEVL